MPSFLNFILNILFPKKDSVIALERRGKERTLRNLPPAPDSPEPWMRSIFAYKDPRVRELVWEIKYTGNNVLIKEIGELMAEEILSFFEERGSFVGNDWILVPIPASTEHLKEKGFNQTVELTRAIVKSMGKESPAFFTSVLYKIIEHGPQAKIKNRKERMKNVVNCFSVKDPAIVTGKNIIVIDDVLTTGSTLIEARRALKTAGAKKVIALTVAH